MPSQPAPQFLILGGAHLDQIGRPKARLEAGQSNPGHLSRTVGGVAGNIARTLRKLDCTVAMAPVLGADTDGDFVRTQLENAGIDLDGMITMRDQPTATYTAIEDRDGSLIAAIADMEIYEQITPDAISSILSLYGTKNADLTILADTNLPQDSLERLLAEKGAATLAVCAVSGPKANRAAPCLAGLDLLFCNEAEAAILAREFADLEALPHILRDEGVKAGAITRGNAGLTAWQGDQIWHLPAPPIKVRSTNGAGDCLAASLLFGLADTSSFEKALPYGMAGASFALMSNQAVPDIISRDLLKASL